MSSFFFICGAILAALHHYRVVPFETEDMAQLSGVLSAYAIVWLVVEVVTRHKIKKEGLEN